MVEDIVPAKTNYIDAHKIRIAIDAVENAFMYIFEISAVSTSANEWIFAVSVAFKIHRTRFFG